MKTFYIIRKFQTTIRDKNFKYSEGCAVDAAMEIGCSLDFEEVFKTEDKTAAEAELSKYQTYVWHSGFDPKEFEVTEYWLDEEQYDEECDYSDLVGTIKYAAVTYGGHIEEEEE